MAADFVDLPPRLQEELKKNQKNLKKPQENLEENLTEDDAEKAEENEKTI